MSSNQTTGSEAPKGPESIWKDPKVVEDYRSAEKVTVVFARSLVEQSGILSTERGEEALSILDHACGTGVVSGVLHEKLSDWKVKSEWKLTCADLSEAMIDAVKARINAEGWKNTDTAVVDLQKARLPSAHYTHVFVSFGQLKAERVFLVDRGMDTDIPPNRF